MFTSWTKSLKTLRAWRRARFPHALFVPVALTLVAASLVGADLPSISDLVLRGLAAWMSVFTLRLWDDLEDRQRDAESHPERVLTQVDSIRSYGLTVAILLFISGVLILLVGAAPVWLGLVGTLLVFYRFKGQTRVSGDFVILLKYPALVLALGVSWQPAGLAAMALVFAAVAMDEVLQAPSLKSWAVIAGAVFLAETACLLIIQTSPPLKVLAFQSALVAGMVALSIQSLFGEARRKLTRAGLLAMTLFTLLLCNTSKFVEILR